MSGWPATDSSEVPGGRRRGPARVREALSLGLMLLPLVAVAAFLLVNSGVWVTGLAVFFSDGAETVRRDPGWILAVLALAATLACAVLGLLGTRDRWKYNRRWQRGLMGSIAATLSTVLFSSWTMTQALQHGSEPKVGLSMFVTMCAMLYGVLCAMVSPRDAVFEPER
ncbi:hypothetical protein FB468_1577 [Leucobacter komagatae]|uniref:Uncharacterized protein n=1 Tax=Leucobacter komagatae TaxID=55969 RepID=A0A542Y643_9MICO|nr:hypothetical protein [Leucobacter komagatae]TQL43551.1 hypothetical protein FB468_1577 [Leucobacter komagatae]